MTTHTGPRTQSGSKQPACHPQLVRAASAKAQVSCKRIKPSMYETDHLAPAATTPPARSRQPALKHSLCPYQAWIKQAGPAVLVEGSRPWIATAVTCSHAH